MIETYKIKIQNKLYDERVAAELINYVSTTRNHNFKLYKKVIKYDLRKYSFTERIVDLWNCLPACVIKSPSVDSFMINLDKFW